MFIVLIVKFVGYYSNNASSERNPNHNEFRFYGDILKIVCTFYQILRFHIYKTYIQLAGDNQVKVCVSPTKLGL